MATLKDTILALDHRFAHSSFEWVKGEVERIRSLPGSDEFESGLVQRVLGAATFYRMSAEIVERELLALRLKCLRESKGHSPPA